VRIASETNLLALNAAIEAARVRYGSGYGAIYCFAIGDVADRWVRCVQTAGGIGSSGGSIAAGKMPGRVSCS